MDRKLNRRWWREVRRLSGLLGRPGNGWVLVSATKALRRAVGQAMHIGVDQGRVPSERTLRRAIDACEALPQAMRRRLDSGADATPFLSADRMRSLAQKAGLRNWPARPLEQRRRRGLSGEMDLTEKGRWAMVWTEEMERDALWEELRELRSLIDRRLPVNHALRGWFGKVLDVPDNTQPDLADLRRLKEAFYRRPDRQQLLGGWWPEPDRPGKADLLEAMDREEAVRRVLVLETGGREEADRRQEEGLPDGFAGQEFRVCSGACPVTVMIREGTSRKEAVEALRAILRMVAQRFDGLVATPFPGLKEYPVHAVSPEPVGTSAA